MLGSADKKNIIIVECRSTGINFIEDIVNRGYYPVILNPKYGDSERGDARDEASKNDLKHVNYKFDFIDEKDTYEETLELVRKYNPLLVLPGNEKGVRLASRLANDLNLICNDIKNLDAMTYKDEMQKRIAEYGLRSIRGKVVKSIEEAIEFYDNENLKQVVLKPKYSSGSTSVRMCANKEEMINTLKDTFHKFNSFGEALSEILVQERIVGDEYIVNTVSCAGEHRVTLVWKYHKIQTADGAMVYDTCESVNELNLGEAEMIEYAYDVADALGIEYGPVHGEYMIDENGPVLIEVNCRPCGGHMSTKFLDKISGQHETDSILDAYLKPARFQEELKRKYELYNYGALKFFIVPKDMVATSTPMKNISIELKSHVETAMDNLDETDKKTYFKTDDVSSACGIVYLVHDDYSVIQDNINYLRNIEKHAFSLVLSDESDKGDVKEPIDIDKFRQLIEKSDIYGTGLFITDEYFEDIDILQVSPDSLNDIGSEFDYVILNLNESMVKNDTETLIKILLSSIEKVKTSGTIIIPKSTYQHFNSGRKGVEALIKLLDLKIELPPYKIKNTIVASKR
ncbi:hypothetical protein TL18_04335 [Methanobrevibacter sp. YE315]|uniref:ATP-grasp domain-containing protein n=1 Tax=Methanobrevibacter sp. YE315 TaxID=1609968 RepID=UPI000764E3DF|nr:ATP-grasp domain-containing protein [Methanobrevibacter sp. YE315]AMD17318.1 hypothetical protein TL18_04335 [Methanobrevibacter sp. YE315]